MPKYVIEREIPNSNAFTEKDLQRIAQKSCDVLSSMGPQIQWLQSYVTADKWYCVYKAPNKEEVLEHAKRGGFPANAINELITIVDPEDAEAAIMSN